MKKGIAFFDFDGTITNKDSLFEFIKFSRGNGLFLLGMLLNSPYLMAFKLKWISNQKAKEKILQYFFRGMPLSYFNHLCSSFTQEVLPSIIRQKAVVEIEKLKKSGVEVVIVSASPEPWIKEWTHQLGIQLLGSRLEVTEGKITGKIAGKNCHGEEKVRRILERYVLSEYEPVYAYGDSTGDKPMLKLASRSFYKPFRN